MPSPSWEASDAHLWELWATPLQTPAATCHMPYGGGVFTFFAAFLSPKQVIFSQDPPVATGLGSTEQVPRLQEREDIECQLQEWKPSHKGTVGSCGW